MLFTKVFLHETTFFQKEKGAITNIILSSKKNKKKKKNDLDIASYTRASSNSESNLNLSFWVKERIARSCIRAV